MFDKDAIYAVYSGPRRGCACGCKGKYAYATADDSPDYLKDRNEGVSNRSIAIIANRVEALLRDGSEVERVWMDADWIAVDIPHRTYTLYFRE